MLKLVTFLVLCGGCFVLPKTKTTTRDLGTSPGEVQQGAVTAVTLHAGQSDNAIVVNAIAKRECVRPFYRSIEVTKEKHAAWSSPKDGRAAIGALVIAPVTIPLSAIVTGFAVLVDGSGTTTRRSELVRSEKLACTSDAAGVPVAVRLPLGTTIHETTDDHGAVVVAIPDTEPYRGVATIDGPNAQTQQVAYARRVPGVTATRDAVYACAAQHAITGAVRIEVTVDERGRATHVGLDRDDPAFAACVTAGIAPTSFTQHDAKLVLPLTVPVAAL